MADRKRRQYGTGSVYQRADGRWIGVLQIGWNERGGRRTLSVSGKSATVVRTKLARRRAQLEKDGAPVEGLGSRTTVKRWAEVWLDRKSKKVRPTTRTVYASAITAWIVPVLGSRQLEQLTPAHVRKVADAVEAAGKTSTHAKSVQRILQRMLKDAIAEGYAVPQRLLLVETPTAAVSDRTAIPTPDAVRLLRAAAADPAGSRWAAALLQGMRQGECLGLTWGCVDLDAGIIDVSWQLQSVPWTHGCGATPCGRRYARGCPARHHRLPNGHESIHLEGAWFLTRPKTSRGRRVIPMVPWMVTALADWRQRAPASGHDLVWPRPDGRPQDKKLDDQAWYALQAAAGTAHPGGRQWTMHEARHTTASILLDAGVDPQTVTAILGHASITTSRSYQHASEALVRQAMEAVAQRLELPA